MTIADVAIVGGGPAGAAAAITLARTGRHVVVVDKARFPRDKCCGDGLTAAGLRHLDHLGLDPAQVPSWKTIDDVWIGSPSGRLVHLPMPRGRGQYAAVARRAELDAALLDVARDAGATVIEGHACTGAIQDDEQVTLTLDAEGGHEPIRARYAVGADGMWSPLRKYLGCNQPGYLGEWHAFRQYFHKVAPAALRDLFVWFDAAVLPGYIWSFPLADGTANVGFGIRRGGDRVRRVQDMAALWPELLARPDVAEVLGPSAEPEAAHRAWPIPARVDRVQLTHGRALFVGDAAAATDPMTGEGIAQALLTGQRAAEAIEAAGPHRPSVAVAGYERTVRQELVADHRFAVLLGHALERETTARAAVRAAGLTPWVRRNFGRWLFEDYPRATLFTPQRWRRKMFSQPGAYAYGYDHQPDVLASVGSQMRTQ